MDDELGPGVAEGPALVLGEEVVDEELGISVVDDSVVLGLSVVEEMRSVVDELGMNAVDVASVVELLVVLIDVSVNEGVENVFEGVVVVRFRALVETTELDVFGVVRLAFTTTGIGLVEVIVDELDAAVVRVETVETAVDEFATLVGMNVIRVDALVDKVDKILEVLKVAEV